MDNVRGMRDDESYGEWRQRVFGLGDAGSPPVPMFASVPSDLPPPSHSIAELLREAREQAWNEGAEYMDRQWWESEYATGNNSYWGFTDQDANPYRRPPGEHEHTAGTVEG